MAASSSADGLIENTSLHDYFHNSLRSALKNQRVDADHHTIQYVVNLLANFAHADEFFDVSEGVRTARPLALIYADALQALDRHERNKYLRRLGDLALFVSGIFSDSLNRKVVDIDYYISMGGSAYAYLSDNLRGTPSGNTFGPIYSELSYKFVDFVDVLSEISADANLHNDSDIMRLYELWIRTGSKRAARRLRSLGIEPNSAMASSIRH